VAAVRPGIPRWAGGVSFNLAAGAPAGGGGGPGSCGGGGALAEPDVEGPLVVPLRHLRARTAVSERLSTRVPNSSSGEAWPGGPEGAREAGFGPARGRR
jgi:hypothetical protein